MGMVVSWRLRPFDRVDEVAGEGTPGGHYCGARDGGLCDSRAAERLRGSLAAAAGHEMDPLFDPYSELAGTSDVPDGHCRQRKERRHGCALELSRAHLAAELTVDPPARDAGAHMSSGQSRRMLVCRSRRVGGNRAGTELAHPPCRGDRGDAIELEVGAASRRTYLSQRESQQARHRDGADPVAGHHGDDLTLARVEIGHQVGSARESVH